MPPDPTRTALIARVLKIAEQQAKALATGGWGHAVFCNYQREDIRHCNCGLADLQQFARDLREAAALLAGEGLTPELWRLLESSKPDVQPPDYYSTEAKNGWRQGMAQARTILSFYERGIVAAPPAEQEPKG